MKVRTNIHCKDFSVGYNDQTVLKIPDLEIGGATIALIGHNGAGKSTLIKSMLSLLPQSHGTLNARFSCAEESFELIPHEHMAFCPEEGAVFADITVENYVKLWCRLKHRDPLYFRKGGAYFTELLTLEPLLQKLGRELSKGQRRRVQTAIGFLCEPKLFLFDEPFDGLDVQKTTELAKIIRDQTKRTSFVVSSHRMDVVERLADAVIVLEKGEVVAAGDVANVCGELCKSSFVISNASSPVTLARSLSDQFSDSIIDEVAGQVRVFSESLSAQRLKEAIDSHSDVNGYQMNTSSPSLVDAMNLHLKLASST